MIEFANKDDFLKITRLWHEVFGDLETVILKYLDRFFDRVLVYREEEKIIGMLSLLPISVGKNIGYYVYAVATDEKYRSQGIATKLLEYSKALCGKDKFLLLVPATSSLFEFYEKFGFSPFSCITKTVLKTPEIDETIRLTPISPTELLILRKEYFKDKSFFEWDIDVLELMHDVFGTRFLKSDKGFAVCEVFKNTVNVKELCCDEKDRDSFLYSVCRYFKADLYSYTVPDTMGNPSAMVYGKAFKNPYFNLALD